MQSKPYTCGPAALATALNNIGIISTENEISKLAGTDHTGTTMYGLLKAAKFKGVEAAGMRISIDNLRYNNIVFLTINSGYHYSVILKITHEKVILADPALGNIELTRKKFEDIYSGNALILISKD
ncbi:MAG: cysteine peptidase family C39 domain-containing protein [Methanobacteriaceae archaeon]|nr:cysteine peptidase family C39 domain-containing protein [Methanobacteriaceae archaeon]